MIQRYKSKNENKNVWKNSQTANKVSSLAWMPSRTISLMVEIFQLTLNHRLKLNSLTSPKQLARRLLLICHLLISKWLTSWFCSKRTSPSIRLAQRGHLSIEESLATAESFSLKVSTTARMSTWGLMILPKPQRWRTTFGKFKDRASKLGPISATRKALF